MLLTSLLRAGYNYLQLDAGTRLLFSGGCLTDGVSTVVEALCPYYVMSMNMP
jgi:hypothetical protein